MNEHEILVYLLLQSRLKRLEIKLRAKRGKGTANESINWALIADNFQLIAPCGLLGALGLSARLGNAYRDVSLVLVRRTQPPSTCNFSNKSAPGFLSVSLTP